MTPPTTPTPALGMVSYTGEALKNVCWIKRQDHQGIHFLREILLPKIYPSMLTKYPPPKGVVE